MQRLLSFGPEKNPEELAESYRREQLANLDAAVACSLMASLAENLLARRDRVERYRRLLGNQTGIELINHRPGSACLTQVVRIFSPRGDDLASPIIEALGHAVLDRLHYPEPSRSARLLGSCGPANLNSPLALAI